MSPLTLLDDRVLERLRQESESAPWPKLALCARSGELLWCNAGSLRWLGRSAAQLADRDGLRQALKRWQGAAGEGAMDRWLGITARQPLERLLLPDPGGAGLDTWVEWLSAWVDTPLGEWLVLRARPVAGALLARLDPHSQAPRELSDAPGAQASGVLAVDVMRGRCHLEFMDAPLQRWLGVRSGERLEAWNWLEAGMGAFDTLALLAGCASAEPVSLLLADRPLMDQSAPWVLSITPASEAAGQQRACALLRWQSLAGATPARARVSRPLEADREAVLELDAEGRLRHLGGAWETLSGLPAAMAMGRALTDFCPATARANCAEHLLPVLQGQQRALRMDWPFEPVAGSPLRWLELRLWRDETLGDRCAGTLVDATERVLAQRIQAIQTRALDHIRAGVIIADATRPGYPTVYANAGFSHLTGYGADEVLGRSCSFLQGDEAQQAGRRDMREALDSGRAVSVRMANYRKDGSRFWNQVELSPICDPVSGLVTHFFGLQTDVSEQVQSQEAAARRVAELEGLFRHSPLGIVAADGAGRLLLQTPAVARLTGLDGEALAGQSLAQFEQALRERVGPGQAVSWPEPGQCQVWPLGGGPGRGSARMVQLAAADRPDDEGLRLIFLSDVTAETDLRRMKTQFLATAAHELRAPMGSIRGFTELLLMRQHGPEDTREMLETVRRQALRLNALLTDLLDLSKLEAQGPTAFELGPVALHEVVRRALRVVVLPTEPRPVDWQLGEAPVMVCGHAAKLEQVLINLLSNACKYSPARAPLQLRLKRCQRQGRDWWALSVTDQGVGLSSEHLGQLFTRFFRAQPDGPVPGTGLGLVIVKELVERMGGQVEVQSALGQGSTFTLLLQDAGPPPLAEVPTAALPAALPAARHRSAGAGR
ncbi:ATP-binding protein [Ideonella livida]|uniref:histidine kinase n=1 Tax=Ideonella livida TaxID=2707176 RepID=A0A7C9TIM2_9BURK|nr:ATP-binding protein [Ideonella livida]NDY90502.1 PAS domain S-box protein [Ideonella livida]